MNDAPKWFRPVAFVALLWNLLGCVAYLADVRLSAEDLAKLSAAQQAVYAARPAWSVAATATAVWLGALGCLALLLKKRWALPLLVVSLLGVVVQDIALLGLAQAAIAEGGSTVLGLQALVLVIAIGLVLLALKARQNAWLN
ncbi:hypothetical protein BURK2_01130 [Burkholderiales bacterium]|nr:MAG: hypothetical protein F9K47_11480 [Burkholderiales bacterium]CAG0968234.1 hypothetical protein BURK2_01130 [Burkholderiales bacterium]